MPQTSGLPQAQRLPRARSGRDPRCHWTLQVPDRDIPSFSIDYPLAHSGAMVEEQDRRGPMSADAIAAAIQDFKEHGGHYNESSDEESEDADE
ncbi:hypothetical protein GLOTRDRAFT_128332 [Gloeophyllum trabeum ATCC 11539]|uniref:Uncharacterized protein n=1 Tax=Gloeophyllum trabeum (strain ATCC 11539 / FP-39264 / Madison 617) TaxID=670483 RepID=S7Q8S7_GLOTA|nr:uncharacterized protein GLOTRDRAFT_128331 [Gloeophyllum trabeum ATCC 11539]XP_007865126.1 uncharacterized protein GLOTRDRAFT_128332 [Gloeophyllum trabeum ATCC 11539]EPQ56385.1 hypothetical protein GLOTRDRAFT_128331 [Gloeophyllum trabeum ATCC 11539]EPQ56386.1 hypothetical protein GLOTRDRAFT_128332 [Gloeophyllum trabeum ATCC 11539]